MNIDFNLSDLDFDIDDNAVFSESGILFLKYKDSWYALDLTNDEMLVFDSPLIGSEEISYSLRELEVKTKDEWSFGRSLGLYLTNSCNLNCCYCYAEAGGGSNTMSLETAKASLDYYNSLCPIAPHINFHGGGEPTLELDLIREVVKVADSLRWNGSKPSYTIVTNGYFSKATCDQLVDLGFAFSISYDGMPGFQNSQRPTTSGGNSSPLVERTIKHLVARKGVFTVNSVLSVENYEKMPDIVRYLSSLGARYIRLRRILPAGRSRQTMVSLDDLKKFYRGLNLACDVASSLDIEILTPSVGSGVLPRCGVGNGGTIAVGYDGHITSCTEVLSPSVNNLDEINCFVYGAVSEEKVQLDRSILNLNQSLGYHSNYCCLGCFARFFCNGGCMKRNLDSTGSKSIPSEIDCIDTKAYLLFIAKKIIDSTI